MPKLKQEIDPNNKPHHLQQTEPLTQEHTVSHQSNLISQRMTPIGNTSLKNTHAAILNRVPVAQQSSHKQLLLQLQRQYGNHYVQQVVQQARQKDKPLIQAKLSLGAVGDQYEQQADQVAKQVVSKISSASISPMQRMETEEDELAQMKPDIQRQPMGEATTIDPNLEQAIQQARGGGQQLAESVRAPMEQAFGVDFSGVRVHTDAQSDQLNQSIQAKAFTTGQDIFFRQGQYNFGSREGLELVAHELTHVVQQNGVERVQRFHMEDARANEEGAEPFISQGVQIEDSEDTYDYTQHVSKETAKVKVSDDGTIAIEASPQPKTFFTLPTRIKEFNQQLEQVGSWYRLENTGRTIQVKDSAHNEHTLYQTFPINLRTHTSGPIMITKQLCNYMAAEVTGVGSTGRLEPKFKPGEETDKILQTGKTSNSMANEIATLFVENIDQKTTGEKSAEEYTTEYVQERLENVKENELPIVAAIAKEMGINEYTPVPEIGDAYVTYSTGEYAQKGKWNYHWGGVVGKAGTDIITLENYARSSEIQDVHEQGGRSIDYSPSLSGQQKTDIRYFFHMYGTEKIKTVDQEQDKAVTEKDVSFHSESKLTDDFLNPITILFTGKQSDRTQEGLDNEKIPVAQEYFDLLKESTTIQDRDLFEARKLYLNWDKLPLIVTRVVDALERQKKENPERNENIETQKQEFITKINEALDIPNNEAKPFMLSDLLSNLWQYFFSAKKDQKYFDEMRPKIAKALKIIEEYTNIYGIKG
jgi:hypothetical protein